MPSRSAAGTYTLSLSKDRFPVEPLVDVVAVDSALGGAMSTAIAVISKTADTATTWEYLIATGLVNGGNNTRGDENFKVFVDRAGSDYKAPKGYFLGNIKPTQHVTGGTEYPLPLETINGVQKYSRKFLATGSFSAPFTIATTVTGLDVENIIVIARRSDGIWLKPNMSGTTRYLVHYADTTGVVYFDRASDTWTDVKVEIQYK